MPKLLERNGWKYVFFFRRGIAVGSLHLHVRKGLAHLLGPGIRTHFMALWLDKLAHLPESGRADYAPAFARLGKR